MTFYIVSRFFIKLSNEFLRVRFNELPWYNIGACVLGKYYAIKIAASFHIRPLAQNKKIIFYRISKSESVIIRIIFTFLLLKYIED
jgi:hypothetical protein